MRSQCRDHRLDIVDGEADMVEPESVESVTVRVGQRIGTTELEQAASTSLTATVT